MRATALVTSPHNYTSDVATARSGARGPARMAMAGFTGITMVGLLKLNITGPGITETVKSVWYTKKEVAK